MLISMMCCNCNAAALYWKMLETGSSTSVHMKLSLRRELLIVSGTLLISVATLPALIYLVGGKLFGPYGATGGMRSLYVSIANDLSKPTLASWTLVLCPAICVLLLRLLFALTQSSAETSARSVATQRREPTVNT
jgi:hypothetical protein